MIFSVASNLSGMGYSYLQFIEDIKKEIRKQSVSVAIDRMSKYLKSAFTVMSGFYPRKLSFNKYKRRVFVMAYGKSIELFLVNGTADSLIIAELSNWNGKAIKIPRIEVASCNRDDITQAGVYFLFCKEDDG